MYSVQAFKVYLLLSFRLGFPTWLGFYANEVGQGECKTEILLIILLDMYNL